MNIYPLVWLFLFTSLIFYIPFRSLMNRRVYSVCSKTYVKKNCKGFINRLLYTPLNERCRFGHLYVLHQWIVLGFPVVVLLALCLGWVPVLQVPIKLLMTLFLTALFVSVITIRPREQVAIYRDSYRWRIWRGSKPDTLGLKLNLWLSVVFEKVWLILLFALWIGFAWVHLIISVIRGS